MKLSQRHASPVIRCDKPLRNVKLRREQRNQSIANIVERLTPLRNLLISTTERCEVEPTKAKRIG